MKMKITVTLLFLCLICVGCVYENKSNQNTNQNNNQENKIGDYVVYYVKTDYTNNVTQLIKTDTDKLEKEVVFSSKDFFNTVIDADKIYVLCNNWIGYIQNNKIKYLMSGESYVSRYLVKDNIIVYGKDNSNASDNYFERLAIMNTNGNDNKELHDSGIGQLLLDDYIYFKPNSGSEINKLLQYNLDGSNKKVLYEKSIGYLIKSNDYFFFVNYDDNRSLYQMKTDGTEPKKIVEGPISFNFSISNQFNGYYSMATINNVLYYIKTSEDNKLYKVDNGINTKVNDSSFASIKAKGNNLFVVYNNKAGIYLLDENGQELKTITNDFISEFYIK